MKIKTVTRKALNEQKISCANFRTSGEISGEILNNLKKNCTKQEKAPLLDIFPDAGLAPGALTVLCAMPCIGKTAYLLNVALGLAQKGKNVAVFLPDGTSGEAVYLAASVSSGGFFYNMMRPWRNPKARFQEFRAAALHLPKTGLYLSKRSIMDQGDIQRDAAELAAALEANGRNLDAIIVDSLNYVKDEDCAMGPLSDLYEAAKKLQVSVICSFPMKENEQTCDGQVRLADIRAAGVDERYTTQILYLHRPEFYNREDPTLKNKALLRFMYSKDMLPMRDYELDFKHETLRFTKHFLPTIIREGEIL